MALKVFLVDDNPLVVTGFAALMREAGVEVVGVSESLQGMPHHPLLRKVDVLITALQFAADSKEGGLEGCRRLLSHAPQTQIVVYSELVPLTLYLVEKCYRAGILGFVRTDENPQLLVAAIHSAARHQQYFSPEIAKHLAATSVNNSNPEKLLNLKELAVLVMIANGNSHAQIAKQMDLSLTTVSALMRRIKAKLGVANPVDLTKLAIRYGLTTTEFS